MTGRHATVWIICLVIAATWCAWQIGGGHTRIDADFISLIGQENPGDTGEFNNINAVRHILAQDSRKAIFMVSAPNRDHASNGANDLAQRLSWINGTEKVTTPDDRAGRLPELIAFLQPHAAALLSPQDREALQAGKGAQIYQRAVQNLYSPTSTVSARSLQQDPFSLLPQFLGALAGYMGEGGGVVSKNGRYYVPVVASLDPRLTGADRDGQWVRDANSAANIVTRDNDISVARTGQVFFAVAEASHAKADVQRIALLATTGIVFMVGLVFFSWGPLLAALITLASGILAGITAITLVFGTIHAIAMVFGSSLIGIAVDYALHYVSIDPKRGSAQQRLRLILPGLTLGLITSVVGFAALSISPTLLLTQIAIYSVSGLIGAYLTVIFLLPFLPVQPVRNYLPIRRSVAILQYVQYRMTPPTWGRLLLVAVILAGFGASPFIIKGDDNIRNLGRGNTDLIAQTTTIRQVLDMGASPMFLRVNGATAEDRLQTEEALRPRLSPLLTSGALDGLVTLADIIPSQKRQSENINLVKTQLYAPYGQKLASILPIDITAADAATGPLLLPDDASLHVLPELATLQSGNSDIVRLRGVQDASALKSALSGMKNIALIDPASAISSLFGQYRQWAYLALGVAMFAALVLAIFRYGLRDGICVFGAPAGAVLCALVGSFALGVPHNFFTTMALFLVFAIGADYVLFLAESRHSSHDQDTSLAVLLSLISSVLAFGLLATSSVPLVSDIGTVIAIGLIAAWILAPVMAGRRSANPVGIVPAPQKDSPQTANSAPINKDGSNHGQI
jgi:predicted exporter